MRYKCEICFVSFRYDLGELPTFSEPLVVHHYHLSYHLLCVIECVEHVPGTSLNSVDGLELIITLGWVGAIISFPEAGGNPSL